MRNDDPLMQRLALGFLDSMRSRRGCVELFAPQSYWKLVDRGIQPGNGCGTPGLPGRLVPETLWLLRITEACNIHDHMYYVGETMDDKDEADDVFKNNMLRIIEHAGGPGLLQRLRRNRALVYYNLVRWFGGPAFWKGKNSPLEFRRADDNLLQAR